METDSKDVLGKTAEGFGREIAEEFIKKIREEIKKLRDHKLGFIQERETIDRVRNQLKTNEHSFYSNHIKDKEMMRYISLGLTLRDLDRQSQEERRDNLKNKIQRKFGRDILHIAYLVQNGILSRYITMIIEETGANKELMNKRIEDILKNVEKHSYFIQKGQQVEQVVDTIKTKITANSPEIFVISGMGPASDIVSQSFEKIKGFIKENYHFEKNTTEKRETIFLFLKE